MPSASRCRRLFLMLQVAGYAVSRSRVPPGFRQCRRCRRTRRAAIRGFTAFTWVGFFVPAKTSDATAGKLNTAINDALRHADTRRKLEEIGFAGKPAALDDANAEFKREIEHWGRMVTTLDLSAN